MKCFTTCPAVLARRVTLSLVGAAAVACGSGSGTVPTINSSMSSTRNTGGVGAGTSSIGGGAASSAAPSASSSGTGSSDTFDAGSAAASSAGGLPPDEAGVGQDTGAPSIDASSGSSAGSAVDAGGGEGGAGGGCSTALFCDGFEGSSMLGSAWMLDNSTASNTVEVVTNMAHSGTNSLHIKYGTSATATYADESKGFPAPNDTYWGRVWMYAMTGLEGGHHVYIEARVGSGGDHTGVRALNTQGTGKIATNLESSDQGGTSNVSLPQGKWTCFEWHITGGKGNGTVHLYMDGTEVPGTAETNWTIPTMMKQRIGIQRYSGGSAGEIWYDDYAMGLNRIGCD